MGARKTNEEFLFDVSHAFLGEDYTFLEPYQTQHVPLMVRHKCGAEYAVTPYLFLFRNARCHSCFGVKQHGMDTALLFCKSNVEYGQRIYYRNPREVLDEGLQYRTFEFDIVLLNGSVIGRARRRLYEIRNILKRLDKWHKKETS